MSRMANESLLGKSPDVDMVQSGSDDRVRPSWTHLHSSVACISARVCSMKELREGRLDTMLDSNTQCHFHHERRGVLCVLWLVWLITRHMTHDKMTCAEQVALYLDDGSPSPTYPVAGQRFMSLTTGDVVDVSIQNLAANANGECLSFALLSCIVLLFVPINLDNPLRHGRRAWASLSFHKVQFPCKCFPVLS